MSKRHAPILLALALLAAAPLMAREPDGTLGLIRTPNNGIPALVVPGGAFEAVLAAKAELFLARDGQEWPLAAEWSELPGGAMGARCAVPAGLAPGPHALRAKTDGKADENLRSVWVFDAFPEEYYVVAHVSDTHIGKERYERPSDDIIRDVIAAVNESEAALLFITGDLTEGGDPEQFRRFLALLDTSTLPSFVCPGNHDRQALHYEQFFGPMAYRFTFGRDGYLSFDTKDFMVADELGPQDGLLHLYRREIGPSRWSVGLTHRYEAMMGMRAQLTLFVDDPLDFILQGHTHQENEPGEAVPWGTTPLYIVPAAIDGRMRLLDVTEQGVIPRPVQKVAETGPRRDGAR